MAKTYRSPQAIFRDRLRGNISLMRGKKPLDTCAKEMGMTFSTFRNRTVDPLKMSLGEAYAWCRLNHVDISDFVGKELKIG